MRMKIIYGVLAAIFITGCSAAQKARKEEREKVVQSKGVFCDFVSESDFKDVEVELNIRLARKCDVSKPFNISSYKRVSENPGVLYCCNTTSSLNSSALDNESSTNSKSDLNTNTAQDKNPTPSTSPGTKNPVAK